MEICDNMAAVIRAHKEASGKSLTEFAQDLEISRSALQTYLAGEGNPNVATIEHLAHKLDLDPSLLVSSPFSQCQLAFAERLLDSLRLVEGFSPQRRKEFATLFVRLLLLLTEEESTASYPLS